MFDEKQPLIVGDVDIVTVWRHWSRHEIYVPNTEATSNSLI